MELQMAFNALVGIVMFLGGWVLGTLWKEIKDARMDHADLILKLPETYARKDDVVRSFERFSDTLERIENDQKKGFERLSDKLDHKADKT